MKEDYQKALKKATLFSLSNPVTFNDKVFKNTRGLEPFRLQNKFRKIPLLVMYYLTKFGDVIYIDIINYSTSLCPFESGKFGKESEYLENEKNFLDEIKNLFDKKNKNLIRNSGHKL